MMRWGTCSSATRDDHVRGVERESRLRLLTKQRKASLGVGAPHKHHDPLCVIIPSPRRAKAPYLRPHESGAQSLCVCVCVSDTRVYDNVDIAIAIRKPSLGP